MNLLEEKYNKVFDADGDVKACGREITKELIAACMKLEPRTDFGNIQTGVMNVENIKQLYIKTQQIN